MTSALRVGETLPFGAQTRIGPDFAAARRGIEHDVKRLDQLILHISRRQRLDAGMAAQRHGGGDLRRLLATVDVRSPPRKTRAGPMKSRSSVRFEGRGRNDPSRGLAMRLSRDSDKVIFQTCAKKRAIVLECRRQGADCLAVRVGRSEIGGPSSMTTGRAELAKEALGRILRALLTTTAASGGPARNSGLRELSHLQARYRGPQGGRHLGRRTGRGVPPNEEGQRPTVAGAAPLDVGQA